MLFSSWVEPSRIVSIILAQLRFIIAFLITFLRQTSLRHWINFSTTVSFPSFMWPVLILGFVADHLWLTSANPSQSWLPRNQTLAMLLTSSFDTFIAIHHDATSNPPASSASPPPQAAFLFINEVRHRFSRVLWRIASQVFTSLLSRYKSAFRLKIFHILLSRSELFPDLFRLLSSLFVFLVTSSQPCHP